MPMRLYISLVGAVLLSLSCQYASSSASACITPSRPEEVCIGAGTFEMGHSKLPPVVREDIAYNPMPLNTWAPQHAVTLRAFHIDRTEVTWGRYRRCVDAGICSRRGLSTFPSTRAALNDPSRADRPAFNILYDEARVFCLWDGKRLPAEAEWERAARGTDGRDFPWGSGPAEPALLRALTTYAPESTSEEMPAVVGTNPQDVSPDGVHDLFANVREWVADWYSPDAYVGGARDNPTGPPEPVFVRREHEYGWGNYITASGERVIRGERWNLAGGRAWDIDSRGAPSWFRGKLAPGATGAGFRCARDDVEIKADLPSFPVYRDLEFRVSERRGAP